MQEGLKDSHQRIFVLTQETKGDLACSTKGAYVANPTLAARRNFISIFDDLPLYP